MTTTIQSFNALLRSFLEELSHTFPEDATLSMAVGGLDQLIKANVRKPLDMFTDAIVPHAGLIMAKDPALFDQSITIAGTVDLKSYWLADGLSDASKDAIWQYLQSMLLLATTVRSLPPEMLSTIESMAESCAEKISAGKLDFGTVAQSLMGAATGPAGSSPLAGLAALLGDTDDASTTSTTSTTTSTSAKKKTKKK